MATSIVAVFNDIVSLRRARGQLSCQEVVIFNAVTCEYDIARNAISNSLENYLGSTGIRESAV